jgi:hypothetical protein
MEVVGEMKHKKVERHSEAVAGVIEALLMVALVSVVISLVQLIYIPQIMEQREAEHMDQVSNQMSTLKSMIDLQGMTRSSTPISSMITLGSRELPYFITAKAFGSLSVQENIAYKITIFPEGTLPNGVPLTSIIYNAYNSYFPKPYCRQTYILEGGGIIVTQPDGIPVMRADPSISVKNETLFIRINITIPHIIAITGKNSTNPDGEEGKCFIRTNYSSTTTYTNSIPSGGNIHIYTAYPNAWNQSLYNILGIYAVNGYLHITPVSAQPTSYVELTPGSKDIILQLTVINIFAQIGQGWIL